MFKPGLRVRIAAAFAIVCIGVVGALGFTLYTASEEMEYALIDQIVSAELDFLIARHRAGWKEPPAPGPHLQYYMAREQSKQAALPEVARNLGPGHHAVGGGVDERHVAIRDVDGMRFIVVYDAGPHELREMQFKNLLLLALATVIVIAIPLGYWLSGLLTRQLTDLSTRVSMLAPGEPHEPLTREGQDREVASLARALDDYQARMINMIRREQEFTANASHELRTPLTAIATSCELLAADPGLDQKAQRRVAFIHAAAQRMAEQIRALLFLARDQAPAGVEPVELAECATEATEPYRAEIARKGLALEIAIERGTVIELNRQALHLVLANLIKNAVQHTDHGFVRVSYAARRLTVSDSGAGIAPEHLPRVFDRHFRGDQSPDGLGLGLAIVKRICDQCHWKTEVTSSAAAGSAFSITFPRQ